MHRGVGIVFLLVGSAACGAELGPRPKLAEVPIGTYSEGATESASSAAAPDSATSSSGMVAAKLGEEDVEAAKPAAPQSSSSKATATPRGRKAPARGARR